MHHSLSRQSQGQLNGAMFGVPKALNPLWIMAYDNFPMDTIAIKERWISLGVKDKAWFTFYHDPFVPVCRFDNTGNKIQTWGSDLS